MSIAVTETSQVSQTIADTTETSQTQLTVASGREVRAVALDAARPHLLRIVLAVILLIGGATAALVTPRLMGSIVDLVSNGERLIVWTGATAVWWAGGLMVAATAASALLTSCGFILMAGAVDRVIARLRERVIDSGMHLPLARLERVGAGDLIARTTDDVTMLTQTVSEVLPAVTGAGFAVAVTLIGMAALDWRFALVGLALLPVYAFALHRYRRSAPAQYLEERRRRGRRAAELLASLRGLSSVRVFALQPDRRARIGNHSWAVVRLSISIRIINNRLFGRVNFAEWLGMTLLLVIGFHLVRDGAVSVGAVTAATLYFLRMFGPIGQLLLVVDPISSASASLRRMIGVIVETAQVPTSSAPERRRQSEPCPTHGHLRATNISFSYGDREVLADVSLEVASGRTLAVVGVSGAGKSTLAAVLAGLRPPASGDVRLGSTDITDLDPTVRARLICMVTQDVHVFSGTLREDLMLARPGATDADLDRALRAAGAEDWVAELEAGLDTTVGVQGTVLTPVQAQQVALARVALVDPAVVVLDEATAEAGSSGAAELESAALRIADGRTAVVIAHRLDQAARADEVILMRNGRIIEQGTHDQLIAARGEYAQLWSAWSAGRSQPVRGQTEEGAQ
ncbi:ABC transporter ATP-binding protein [Nocardia sp. IBHARD005]|uniref:ABC transporter ATP-binding protein n=1 Tax=Nocardia sp. IBHARD005 TaxID=3457765 RepID=UPI0040581D2E